MGYMLCVLDLIDWLNFIIYAAPSGGPHHLCLLWYNIPVGFVKIVASHGNSKQSTPFLSNIAQYQGYDDSRGLA